MAIWLVLLVMKLGKMAAALPWLLTDTLAERIALVVKFAALEAESDVLTNSVLPEKPVKVKK